MRPLSWESLSTWVMRKKQPVGIGEWEVCTKVGLSSVDVVD